jgi:hypothetical protein
MFIKKYFNYFLNILSRHLVTAFATNNLSKKIPLARKWRLEVAF